MSAIFVGREFFRFEGNELCGNYSTNDAYVQIQRFLDHDSEGEFAKPGYDDLIIPMNIEFDELSKDEEVNTTHEEASAKRTRKGKIKVNKTKKVKREKLKTTPKPLKYVCSICNYKSKRSDHHKRHLMIHLKNKPIKCFVCKYNTGRSDHYKRHLLRHGFSHQAIAECCQRNGVKLKQMNPSQELLAKENLVNKKVQVDLGERKKFLCLMCGYSTDKNSHYSRHLHTHSGDQPYRCCECKKTFKLESYLKKHRCSRKKGHVCPACGSIFINSRALEVHCRKHVDENLSQDEMQNSVSTHEISDSNDAEVYTSNNARLDKVSHEPDGQASGLLRGSKNSNGKPNSGLAEEVLFEESCTNSKDSPKIIVSIVP